MKKVSIKKISMKKVSMKKKQKTNTINNIALIDKIHLIKIDLTFMSNLFLAWNCEDIQLNSSDMFALSKMCDNISLQVNECEDLIN